jgi:hypothetical protein
LDLLKIFPSRLGALMRATERLQESVAVVSNDLDARMRCQRHRLSKAISTGLFQL